MIRCTHPAYIRHSVRLAQMYAGARTEASWSRKFTGGQMRLEGARAAVALARKYLGEGETLALFERRLAAMEAERCAMPAGALTRRQAA